MRNCNNCHFGIVVDPMSPCNGQGGCFFQRENPPDWQPLTNGDMVRRKSDQELAALLWSYKHSGGNVTRQDILEWLREVAKE